MICPNCKHHPTFWKALRQTQFRRFPCSSCGAELSAGFIAWLVCLVLAVPSVLFAIHAANQFTSGTWSPVRTAFYLCVYILAVGGAAEWAMNRYLTASRARERAV